MSNAPKLTLRLCGQCLLMTLSISLFVYTLLYHRPVSGPQKGQETLAEKIQRNVVGNEITNQVDEASEQKSVFDTDYKQNAKNAVTASDEDTSR